MQVVLFMFYCRDADADTGHRSQVEFLVSSPRKKYDLPVLENCKIGHQTVSHVSFECIKQLRV